MPDFLYFMVLIIGPAVVRVAVDALIGITWEGVAGWKRVMHGVMYMLSGAALLRALQLL